MFKRIIFVCIACIALFNFYFLYVGKYLTFAVLCIALVAYFACYYLAKLKSVKMGSALFLAASTGFTCFFMWRNEGLFDEAIIAFPGFLIFAVMISSFTLARWLLVFIIVNVLAIGLVNEYGIYTHPTNASDLDSAIVLSIMLIMVSASAYVAFVSIHRLLNNLSAENEKVKKSQREIFRLQNHDPLTGLPNRILAQQIFEERLKIGNREGFETSLLFIDLDNFKTINDTYGHATGDELLKAIAQRLQNSIRDTDTACRFGGDEFVVVAMHERNERFDHESALAEKLVKGLSETISIEHAQVSPTVSIGISVAPTDATSFEELYKKADLAMYAAKESGRNAYQYYSTEMQSNSARYLKIAQALRNALSNNEFELHYQSTQRLSDGKVMSAEALLRWHHPSIKDMYPDEFIPIAERSGRIQEIGAWVLSEAVKTCKSWHQNGFEDMSIAVNVSAIQFHRGNFAELVKTVLEENKLDGKYLTLELTESLLFDIKNKFSDTVSKLVKMGVKIAVDDFGTGYSNLGYLHKNDISILKIDRSFISKIHESSHDLALVESMIQMSKSLDMAIIAEGIETEESRDKLRNMACHYGQGYLWNKPMNAARFADFLKGN
ncbi:EAL domain-containing protein [Glaciecola sp. MH2013]|uniref:putative bifunctional diguanylate cyclase/phosphodiesterase n=1 Tax=Glaciecola sp. MH2013 TaxID=2785524 RepID=UPI00189D6032|nr:EAL domain-containing protein [Glaciecola sp. MH2013]MBF7074245.1 EAL domain-containing protein [Glaciecola sp. MH2013]